MSKRPLDLLDIHDKEGCIKTSRILLWYAGCLSFEGTRSPASQELLQSQWNPLFPSQKWVPSLTSTFLEPTVCVLLPKSLNKEKVAMNKQASGGAENTVGQTSLTINDKIDKCWKNCSHTAQDHRGGHGCEWWCGMAAFQVGPFWKRSK